MVKLNKVIGAFLASSVILSNFTGAFASNNEYYKQALRDSLLKEKGVSDLDQNVSSVEDFNEINYEYYRGMVSAYTLDFDNDGEDELLVVETTKITAYDIEDGQVVPYAVYNYKMLGNEGESYSNIFVKPIDDNGVIKNHLCVELYSNTLSKTSYSFSMLKPSKEEKRFIKEVTITREKTDTLDQRDVCSYNGVSVYTYTYSSDKKAEYSKENYENQLIAARAVLKDIGFSENYFVACDKRLFFNEGDNNVDGMDDITWEALEKLKAVKIYNDPNIASVIPVDSTDMVTFSYANGINVGWATEVIIKDYTDLKRQAGDYVKVKINGYEMSFDQDPIIQQGRTLVPVRAIFEALGCEVHWFTDSRRVVACTNDKYIAMQLDNVRMYVNGEVFTLDVPLCMVNDRTLVPVRAISEALNAKVNWDQNTKTVTIEK